MPTPITMPEAGESVVSGVLTAWIKPEGAFVQRDETVAEIDTDKITVEVMSPAAGVLAHAASEGDEIEIGSAIGTVDEKAEAPVGATVGGGGDGKPTEPAPSKPEPAAANPSPAAKHEPQVAPSSNGSVHATPLAKKLADDHKVDLGKVHGTGVGGRIREQDVVAFMQAGAGVPAPAAETAAPPAGARTVTVERMTPLRQKIASRLVEAQQTAAMLTTFNECDMSAVMDLRKQYKEPFKEKHGVGLGFMSFFIKAVCGALREFPKVNAQIVADDAGRPAIQTHGYCDVAIAVSSPKGLVVPVIRDAETLGFAGIEQAVRELALRARDGKLELSEMQGGTFTITNGGIFGSLLSTPILNPPQSAILGMHAIKNRAVEHPAGSGQVAIRPMMNLAVSYDHRIIDGAEAVRFLVSIKEAIEDPSRVMLQL